MNSLQLAPLAAHAVASLVVASAATSAPQTSAQADTVPYQVRQGPASDVAVAMLLEEGSGEILFRSSGDPGGEPSPWSTRRFGPATAVHPRYTRAGILFDCGYAYPNPGAVRFASFSSGNSVQSRANLDGWLEVPVSGFWFALTLSVGAGASALPGSPFALLTEPEGALVSYYDPQSLGIDPIFAGSTVVEQRRPDLGFNAPTAVGDFDYGMGFIAENPDPVGPSIQHRLFATRNYVYFTLVEDSNLGLVPWGPGGASIPANGSTIYRARWNGPTLTWDKPEVWVGAEELGLAPGERIDAIAVDHNKEQVLFSLDAQTSSKDQLLVYNRAVHSGAVTAHDSTGAAFSALYGLNPTGGNGDPTDPKGICTWDPEADAREAVPEVGVPTDTPATEAMALGLCVSQHVPLKPANADPLYSLHVSGIPAPAGSPDIVFYFGRATDPGQTTLDFVPGPDATTIIGAPGWALLGYSIVDVGSTVTRAEMPLPLSGAPGSTTTMWAAFAAVHVVLDGGGYQVGRRSVINRISYQ